MLNHRSPWLCVSGAALLPFLTIGLFVPGAVGEAEAASMQVSANMVFGDAAVVSVTPIPEEILPQHLPPSTVYDTVIASNIEIFGVPNQMAYVYHSCVTNSTGICDGTGLIGNQSEKLAIGVGSDSYTTTWEISGTGSQNLVQNHKESHGGLVVVYL